MLLVEADVPSPAHCEPDYLPAPRSSSTQSEERLTVPDNALVTFAGIEKGRHYSGVARPSRKTVTPAGADPVGSRFCPALAARRCRWCSTRRGLRSGQPVAWFGKTTEPDAQTSRGTSN